MATEHARRSGWKNQLVPHIVDHLAKISPDAVYAEYPKSTLNYDQGYEKITYGKFANAVNGAAQWLYKSIGPSSNHEVLAYVGPNDVRYTVMILAAVKVGYVLLLTSPRNSSAAQGKLFERLGCKTLLSPSRSFAATAAILEAHDLRHCEVPTLKELFDEDFEHFKFEKTFEHAKSEPFWIIHTSGSTGLPKPLIWTNESVARQMNMLSRDPPPGRSSLERLIQGKRVINTFPPFHGACLASLLCGSVPFGTVQIAPVSGTIATASGIADALKQTSADLAFLVPSIVSELAQDEVLLDFCSKKLEHIIYCGGDLPQRVGDRISAKIPLSCQYGASEMGLLPQLLPLDRNIQEWKYIHINPCVGPEFRKATGENSQLYIRHDPHLEDNQVSLTLFPDTTEYDTRDLFREHPSDPNLWRWDARADDIIVFLNGEKTNPISMEQYIAANSPDVLSATVIGSQRFQAGLLLEAMPASMPKSSLEEAAFVERVWPKIQEANKHAPAHARVDKAMILMIKPDKPCIRAGKGTIQRAATLDLYKSEIEQLYESFDELPEIDGQLRGIADVLHVVRHEVIKAIPMATFEDKDNFFEQGLDSLQAMNLARSLRRALRTPQIAATMIYNNPSISQLSEVILALSSGHDSAPKTDKHARAEDIRSTLNKYQSLLGNVQQISTHRVRASNDTVILTGSTGTLGAYLLAVLAADPRVAHIYCLNRRHEAESFQLSRHSALNLPLPPREKVTFLCCDTSTLQLGLSESTYRTLIENVTMIIHNAWPVNFNLPLSTFDSHLQGLINLFELAASTQNASSLFFISSISSVMGFDDTKSNTVPEAVICDVTAPWNNGYAESKFIAESLCDSARELLSIPVSFGRVGQIAGAVARPGLWNRHEWFPSLVISSMHVGALPSSLGYMNIIDWVPIDLLAGILIDLLPWSSLPPNQENQHLNGKPINGSIEFAKLTAKSQQRSEGLPATSTKTYGQTQVYHVQNSHKIAWDTVLPGVRSAIVAQTGRELSVVPPHTWLARIQESFDAATTTTNNNNTTNSVVDGAMDLESHLSVNPAAKLLTFFTEIMSNETSSITGHTSSSDVGEKQKQKLKTATAALTAVGPTKSLDLTHTLSKSKALRDMEGVNESWLHKWIAEWTTSSI